MNFCNLLNHIEQPFCRLYFFPFLRFADYTFFLLSYRHRWAVPRYFFSTGTVGTLEKSTGTAVPVLLLLNF